MGTCEECGAAGATKRCPTCKTAYYCSREHQVAHYSRRHKLDCAIEVAVARALRQPLPERQQRPPSDAHCCVCLESGDESPDNLFLHLGCGCRGSAGWMHVNCLFELVTESLETKSFFCRTCELPFTGPMALRISLKLWRRHRVMAEGENLRLNMERAFGRTLVTEQAIDQRLVMKYLRRQVDEFTELFGPDSAFTRSAVDVLSGFLVSCDQIVDAEALMKPYAKAVEDNDWLCPHTADILGRYAEVIACTGRATEAEAILRSGVRVLSNDAEKVKVCNHLKRHLSFVLVQQGKLTESHELLSALHSDAMRVYGPEHIKTLEVAEMLADVAECSRSIPSHSQPNSELLRRPRLRAERTYRTLRSFRFVLTSAAHDHRTTVPRRDLTHCPRSRERKCKSSSKNTNITHTAARPRPTKKQS